MSEPENQNWFKTSREFTHKHDLITDLELTGFMFHLLARAWWTPNRATINGESVRTEPGTVIIGVRRLALEMEIDFKRCLRFIDKLEKRGTIKVLNRGGKAKHEGYAISFLNWRTYQITTRRIGITDESPENHNRDTDGSPVHPYKNVRKKKERKIENTHTHGGAEIASNDAPLASLGCAEGESPGIFPDDAAQNMEDDMSKWDEATPEQRLDKSYLGGKKKEKKKNTYHDALIDRKKRDKRKTDEKNSSLRSLVSFFESQVQAIGLKTQALERGEEKLVQKMIDKVGEERARFIVETAVRHWDEFSKLDDKNMRDYPNLFNISAWWRYEAWEKQMKEPKSAASPTSRTGLQDIKPTATFMPSRGRV